MQSGHLARNRALGRYREGLARGAKIHLSMRLRAGLRSAPERIRTSAPAPQHAAQGGYLSGGEKEALDDALAKIGASARKQRARS